MTTTFAGYKPWAGDFDKRDRGNWHSGHFLDTSRTSPWTFPRRDRGNLLSHEKGTATGHGLKNAQERGSLFAAPGDEVFENQISPHLPASPRISPSLAAWLPHWSSSHLPNSLSHCVATLLGTSTSAVGGPSATCSRLDV